MPDDGYSERKKEEAARLLAHYVGTVFRRTGLVFDADNIDEMRELVDAICEAVRE